MIKTRQSAPKYCDGWVTGSFSLSAYVLNGATPWERVTYPRTGTALAARIRVSPDGVNGFSSTAPTM